MLAIEISNKEDFKFVNTDLIIITFKGMVLYISQGHSSHYL